jgi:hypothetical protein
MLSTSPLKQPEPIPLEFSIIDHPQVELRTDQPDKFLTLERWLFENGHGEIYQKRIEEITTQRKVILFGLQQHQLQDFLNQKSHQLLLHCIFRTDSSSLCGGILLDLYGNNLEITTHS